MQDFMKGRYGVDDLSLAIGGVGIVLTVAATALAWHALSLIALMLLLLALFRSLSKDLAARQRENEAFRQLRAKIPGLGGRMAEARSAGGYGRATGVGRNLKRTRNTAAKMWRNRRTTKYFRCRSCGAVLSVPRGKGKIRITCPRCRTVVEKRS